MATASTSPVHLDGNVCRRSPQETTHLSSDPAPAAQVPAAPAADHADEPLLHLVMVPFPLQGHINPMMQLAKMLLAKHTGLRITFVNNKHNHDRIQPALASASMAAAKLTSSGSAADAQDPSSRLRLVWLDNGLPPDFDYTDLSPRLKQLSVATSTMKDPLKLLLQGLNEASPRVSFVVFGSFCPWAHAAAVELAIPTVLLWTQSVSVFSLYYHAPLLAANGFFPYDRKSVTGRTEGGIDMPQDSAKDDVVSYIPGVPSLHASNLPTLLHIDDLSDPRFASIQRQLQILHHCDGIIINSFEELEKDASAVIRAELHPCPVYNLGPLLPSSFLGGSDKNDTNIGASLLQEKNDCINWLDTQKTHSVLYISFGSMCSPSKEDLEAIALGIKASKQPFLWVIRPCASVQNAVSDILQGNLVEDTKDYGLIIPWAPQLQVLSHPSIGAFLTHGGWNSTLESLSMGVPMIALPLFSDQPTNSAYVCDVWKVGMALKRHVHDSLTSEGVERVVRAVLHAEEGKDMRRRAQRLREAAQQAVLAQGSTGADMEDFVQGVLRKHRGKTCTSCSA